MQKNANSTAAGPWHIIPVALEIDGNNNTDDKLSVDVARPHLAYYDAGTVEFQIATKTRLQ